MLNFFKKKRSPTAIIEERVNNFEYPLLLDEWMSEFSVGKSFSRDSVTDIEVKKLIINQCIKYNRNNQNKRQL